jgi:hypothetical protein
MVKVVDRVHMSVDRLGVLGPPWTDGVADRGCQSVVARSPEYGLRPLRCTKAHRRGRNRERRARGARLGPHRSSGRRHGGTIWCSVCLFVCVACFRSLPLGAEDFENLQELDVQDFEQQIVGEQGKWSLTILILCVLFLSLVSILACML